MEPFPVLISIPHGGTAVPPELKNRLVLSDNDLFDDSDPFTREIYDIGSTAFRVVKASIARAFVDLSRAPDDLPPANPDGVVKSMTCYKKPIYIEDREPNETLRRSLLQRYYEPYHNKLREIAGSGEPHLALDCHSMAAQPPPISPDYGPNAPPRPMICLGNNHGKACDDQTVETLSACFREAFELEAHDVTVNKPFAGGYITRTHGSRPIPWVQVEMNRSLYLSSPWFDAVSLTVLPQRLDALNNMFRQTLYLFFSSKYGKFYFLNKAL
jgi:formiminoglutamase